MTLILSPIGYDPSDYPGHTAVMLDSIADLTGRLAEMTKHKEFSVLELLNDGDQVVDSTRLIRAGPPGVDVVGFRIR